MATESVKNRDAVYAFDMRRSYPSSVISEITLDCLTCPICGDYPNVLNLIDLFSVCCDNGHVMIASNSCGTADEAVEEWNSLACGYFLRDYDS